MAYTYPEFAKVAAIRQEGSKRYSLEIQLKSPGDQTWLVIQKNPSKASADISDHTINRVLNYLYRNRERYEVLKPIGKVVFLNLIPWYETFSRELRHKEHPLEDTENLKTLRMYLSKHHPCIIGWGNPPVGLVHSYCELATEVRNLIDRCGNALYRVGPLTRLGHPRHGQIWGYEYTLIRMGSGWHGDPEM